MIIEALGDEADENNAARINTDFIRFMSTYASAGNRLKKVEAILRGKSVVWKRPNTRVLIEHIRVDVAQEKKLAQTLDYVYVPSLGMVSKGTSAHCKCGEW